MTFSRVLRRAALLGTLAGVAACDIADLASNPAPRLVHTWNLPVDTTKISVASLLPNGVSILPDSSAFQLRDGITGVNFTDRIGDANRCPTCAALHGTTSPKPQFSFLSGSSTSLPQDIVAAALIGGQLVVQISNNLSFDPLRVKTNAPAATDPNQQGWMLIVVRNGSLIIGRDSVNGATTPHPAGTVLTRNIALQSGNITSGLNVDVTYNSPQGDNPVFINANGTLATVATVPDLRVAQVRMNVVNKTMASVAGDSIPLEDLDEGITRRVIRGILEMSITNPFGVTGNVNVNFVYGPQQVIAKPVAFPAGVAQVRTVTLDSAEMATLFGKRVALDISGGVNSSTPIDVTPRQAVVIANRLIMTVRLGGS